MENRFGVKDFILFVFLVVVVILVVLAMFQYDRQWDELRTIRARLDEQARDLRQIQEALREGVAVVGHPGGNATTRAADKQDPFARMRAARQMENYASGDWLVDMFSKVAKLTPLLSGDTYASQVQSHVLESLGTRDPDTLEWTPLLAREWEIIDNSQEYNQWLAQQREAGKSEEEITALAAKEAPDAVRINFKLREGLRFSDGEPLDADDVVFTYNFIMNPQVAAPRARAYYARIKRVEKKGPLEVEFIYSEPYFQAFDLAASMDVLPEHFYGKIDVETFNNSVGLLLGSGPYRMPDPRAWRPGNPIELVRNERYWGVAPAFDRLIYKEISSDKGRLATFRNGEADIFGAMPEQYLELIKDQAFMQQVQSFEYQNPVGGYRYVAWNQKNPLFADKRVRQALTMLLDRQRMIEEIMYGKAVIATGPFNPQSNQYNTQVEPYPHDVERARQLLQEAGFADRNNDGVLEGPNGELFSFKLTYPGGSGNYDKMVLFMKDAYARAGIVLQPDPLEWNVFTDRLNNKNFEAITLGWTSGIETDIYQMFHSSQATIGGDNFMSYISPELDRLIDEARRTLDEQKRMELWRQAHLVLYEDQPYTFLWFGKSLVFIDKRIANIQRVRLGLNPRYEWFVPIGSQRYGG